MVHLDATVAPIHWVPMTAPQWNPEDDGLSLDRDFVNLLETNLSPKRIQQITEKFEVLGTRFGTVDAIRATLQNFFTSFDADRYFGRVSSPPIAWT